MADVHLLDKYHRCIRKCFGLFTWFYRSPLYERTCRMKENEQRDWKGSGLICTTPNTANKRRSIFTIILFLTHFKLTILVFLFFFQNNFTFLFLTFFFHPFSLSNTTITNNFYKRLTFMTTKATKTKCFFLLLLFFKLYKIYVGVARTLSPN